MDEHVKYSKFSKWNPLFQHHRGWFLHCCCGPDRLVASGPRGHHRALTRDSLSLAKALGTCHLTDFQTDILCRILMTWPNTCLLIILHFWITKLEQVSCRRPTLSFQIDKAMDMQTFAHLRFGRDLWLQVRLRTQQWRRFRPSRRELSGACEILWVLSFLQDSSVDLSLSRPRRVRNSHLAGHSLFFWWDHWDHQSTAKHVRIKGTAGLRATLTPRDQGGTVCVLVCSLVPCFFMLFLCTFAC